MTEDMNFSHTEKTKAPRTGRGSTPFMEDQRQFLSFPEPQFPHLTKNMQVNCFAEFLAHSKHSKNKAKRIIFSTILRGRTIRPLFYKL